MQVNQHEKNRCISTGFLLEGGDSEWFINYLRPIIEINCDKTMSVL